MLNIELKDKSQQLFKVYKRNKDVEMAGDESLQAF